MSIIFSFSFFKAPNVIENVTCRRNLPIHTRGTNEAVSKEAEGEGEVVELGCAKKS